MIPTPTKRRHYQQQEYPAQDEVEEDGEEEDDDDDRNGKENEDTEKKGALFNGFSIKKCCLNNQQQVSKDNQCCGQFSDPGLNDEGEDEDEDEDVEGKIELEAAEDEEDFDYLRLDTIVEEDENSDMEDEEDLGHLDDEDTDFECDNGEAGKIVSRGNQRMSSGQQVGPGKTSTAYASTAPNGLTHEQRALGQKAQNNGNDITENIDDGGGSSKVRPLAEHNGGNSLMNSMRKFSTTSANDYQTKDSTAESTTHKHRQQQVTMQGNGNSANKEISATKQSIQDERNDSNCNSRSSKCDKLSANKKMQNARQQQQQNQIHQPLPSTNRLISEHQARQQQALFRALAERQKMMDEIGASERVDLMSAASFNALRQQQQQQQQNRRKKRRSRSSVARRKVNSSPKTKSDGPSSSSSTEDGVPLSAVDLSSMSDRMLDELLGHIASASSSSLSSNGESLDSSDLTSGNSSDELDEGSQRFRSDVTSSSKALAATTTSNTATMRAHNRTFPLNQASDTPNIIGVHEDERTRTNGCLIALNHNNLQTNNNNNNHLFVQALNNKAKRQLNCRNTHRRSCDNEDDQNDDDEDDDDNNDHELVVHLNTGSDQLHDSSLSPINHQVSEKNNKNKPSNKSSKLEEYFTSDLVNPHEFSDQASCGSPESVTPSKLTAIGRQKVINLAPSKQVSTSKIATASSSTPTATSVAANSKQSVEEVLSQMLSALNEISADDQEQLNELLERGFTHLEQLLNCNLGGGNPTNSPFSGSSVTNQLASATTLSTANTNSLNQRQRQQHTNSANSLLRSQQQQPNNMAQKSISNQQQQHNQLHQSNVATLSKDSDYGSDTQSADCLSHYNDSSASSNDHSNITSVSNQSNNRWTMIVNNQSGEVQSSESPSPTSLTTTTSSSSASAQHSSSPSSSPIIGAKSSQPIISSSLGATAKANATATTLTTSSLSNPNTSSPSQTMSSLSPLAIELSFKLAESLHRLAQQQAATRRGEASNTLMQSGREETTSPAQEREQEQLVANGDEKITGSSTRIDCDGDGCVNLSSGDKSRQSDIEKQQQRQPMATSTMQKVVAPQVAAQKKSPMKSIVMINAARSPSAASIVSTSSSNDFICASSVQQQQRQQQQQRNLTPVQGDISSSSSSPHGDANISQQRQQVVSGAPTKQQFKTCVSIGSATSGVSNVIVGSPISVVAATARDGEETKARNKKIKKRATGDLVNDFDGNEDLKSNAGEVNRQDLEATTENISRQQVFTSAAVNFERARSSRSSLRRRPSFSGSTCSTKEPGAPRPGSPVPRLLLEEPRGINCLNSSDKMSSDKTNNSSTEANNNSLVAEHKKQQKQLQRALILAQKYNYSPTKLAASKLSSKLQLKDLTAAPSAQSTNSWTTTATSSAAINGSQTLNRLGNGCISVDPSQQQDHKWITSETSKYAFNNGTTTGKANILQQHPIRISGQVELDISYFAKSGSLTVHVLQCSQLAPVSKRRTTSNPYVKLYLLPDRSKNGKRKSSIHKSQLNPKFDEKFTFGSLQLSDFDDKILWLSVWHKDRLGRNEFLGEVLIPLSQIRHQLLTSDFCQSTSPKWYQLRERFDASASIKQQGQRQFNWHQTSQLNNNTSGGGRATGSQQWFSTQKNNNYSQQPSWSSSTAPRNGKLNQGFLGAKEGGVKETAASANRLQVDLSAGKQKSAALDAVDKLGELQRKAFRLTSAVAPPADLVSNNEQQQQQQQSQHMNVHLGPPTQLNPNQNQTISGQLFVALKFVPENQELISSRVSRETSGELHVIIKEARNIGGYEALQLLSALNGKDSDQLVGNGKEQAAILVNKPPSGPLPNPFCKCYLLASNGQRIGKQKTPHLKRTANPRWDFKCIFNSVKLSQLTCQAIEILMFNRDSILVSNNDYLGGIRLCQASKTSANQSTTGNNVDNKKTIVGSDSTAATATATTTAAPTQTGKVNEALHDDEPLCSERESRLWNQMLARPNIWVYGELRLRHLRPLIAAVNNVENS